MINGALTPPPHTYRMLKPGKVFTNGRDTPLRSRLGPALITSNSGSGATTTMLLGTDLTSSETRRESDLKANARTAVWCLQKAGSTQRECGGLEHKPETVEALLHRHRDGARAEAAAKFTRAAGRALLRKRILKV